MDETPYKPPVFEQASYYSVSSLPASQKRVQDMAHEQQQLVYCIMLFLLVNVGQVLSGFEFAILLRILGALIVITAMLGIFLIATRVHGVATGVLLSLLALLPLIGVIMLMYLVSQFSSDLRQLRAVAEVEEDVVDPGLVEVVSVEGAREP